MNFLDGIIAGATDDSVSTSNLLRKVQVVAHYLKAEDVTAWVKHELSGYTDAESLPKYRAHLITPVMGTWAGMMGSSAKQLLSSFGIPKEAEEVLFYTNLFQPVAELEDLAQLPEDPSHSWDPWQVKQYSEWNAEGKGVWMVGMNLINAHRVVTRASLRGVVDTVRTTALELALSLQTTDANAGTLNGPTVADAPIASTISTFTMHVWGDGANVAIGDHARQTSEVMVNDVEALLAAARQIGLDDEALSELRAAAEAPETERPGKLKAYLSRVGSGAFALGTAISTEVAASQIDQLIQQFLGQA
ncbi:hypothetical protein [Leifsonia sp. fls2-241-R2A-40a]|uniref:AbiTii domain-containing protein n=1 Tax=Leifsonia sp. fls2-241-R2A-40a TaxID=3040290 RepID=UPI0025514F22|nr:hypothetical protein [Leifsonia sp. fls2-241-R2A-40a]